jgi:hypothetical protein
MDARLEAVVYCRPHAMFLELKRKHDMLFEQYVPGQLKVRRATAEAAFVDVLQDLLKRSRTIQPASRFEIEDEIQRLQEAGTS